MENFGPANSYPPTSLPGSFAAVQGITVLRMASAGYATSSADDPADTAYSPRLYGDISVSQSAVDAFGIGGRVAMGIAEFEVANADSALNNLIAYGTADGRNAVIRVVPVTALQASNYGSSLGSATLAFRGVVQRVDGGAKQRARITITDMSERLATPLQVRKYAGTGGVEGDASLTGAPHPVALGDVFNVTPVFLGNVELGDGALPTYAVNYRAVTGISAVRMRGVEQASTGSAPTVGQYKPWLSSGMFQLGSSADGVVSCDVEAGAGDYSATTGGLIRSLIQDLGPQLADADIQIEAFELMDTDIPGAVGWYRGAEEITAAAAVDEILAGSGAVLCGGRAGTVRTFDPFAAGDAQFALASGTILDLEPVSKPPGISPLPHKVAVDWARNWTPLTDMAAVVTTDRRRLTSPASGPVRVTSPGITTRVLQQRELRLPGLFTAESGASDRAARIAAYFEASPRMFRVTTDRYLGRIEAGDLGAIAYPAYGLDAGVGVVVLAWEELLAGRRLVLTVSTVPWVTIPPLVTGGDGLDYFILDTDVVA